MQLDDIIQKIVLDVSSKQPVLDGLDGTIKKLEAIEAHIKAIDAAYNRVTSTNAAFKRTAAEFTSQIKTKGQQSTETLSQMFGFSPEDVKMWGARVQAETREAVRKAEQAMQGLNKTTPTGRQSAAYRRAEEQLKQMREKELFTSATAETIRSPVAAGRAFEMYSRAHQAEAGIQRNTLRRLLMGGASGGGAPTQGEINLSAATLKVIGKIQLEIPASQIEAKVIGVVSGGVSGGGGGGGGGGGTYGTKGTNGPSGGGGSGGGGGRLGAPNPNELARTIVTKGDDVRTTVTELTKIGETLTTTYDEVNEEIQNKLKINRSSPVMAKWRGEHSQFMAKYRAQIANVSGGDLLGGAEAREGAARHLRESMIPEELKDKFAALGITGPQTRVEAQARILEGQAAGLRQRAEQDALLREARITGLLSTPLDTKSFIEQTLGPKPEVPHHIAQAYYNRIFGAARPAAGTGPMGQTGPMPSNPNAVVLFDRGGGLGGMPGGGGSSGGGSGAGAGPGGYGYSNTWAGPTFIPTNPVGGGAGGFRGGGAGGRGGGRAPFGSGRSNWTNGFQPLQYLKNVATVAGWAAAVYPVMLLKQGLEELIETAARVQARMVPLENAFRGVGGSAKQLATDVMRVTASTGGDVEGGLDAATGWARMGFTRAQITEATRQTTVLSNLSGMPEDKAQAMQRTLMSNYGFGASGLSGLNDILAIAQKRTGVPQQEILAGMAKLAPLASQGGIGLPELASLIATGTQRTGDTGLRTGGSYFAILSQLSKPELRDRLRKEFGIVPQGTDSSYLAEIHRVYQQSSPVMQRRIENVVAGGVRGGRLEAYMKSFGNAQALAKEETNEPGVSAEMNRKQNEESIVNAWKTVKNTFVSEVTAPFFRESQEGKGPHGMTPAGAFAEALNNGAHWMRLFGDITRIPMEHGPQWSRNLFGIVPGTINAAGGAYKDENRWMTKFENWLEPPKSADQARKDDAEQRLRGDLPLRSQEDVQSAEEADSQRQDVLDYLKQRKDLLDGILNVTRNLATIGEEGTLLNQRLVLQGQNSAIDTTLQGLNGIDTPFAAEQRRQLMNEQERVRAELEATQGPAMAIARIADARQVATERARNYSDELGLVGHTPLEQMQNRETGLSQEISRLSGMQLRSDMDSARLLELQRERYENRTQMTTRSERLPYLLQQNQQESQRQFGRDTLFASNSEILARVGAFRLAQSNGGRGIGPGQFFALDPAMRQLYDQIHGGDSGARLREEQRLAWRLGSDHDPRSQNDSRIRAEEEMQGTRQAMAGETDAAMMSPNVQASMRRREAEESNNHLTAAASAAAHLNNLRDATGAATAQINNLSTAVANLNARLGGSNAAVPQNNPQGGGQVLGGTVSSRTGGALWRAGESIVNSLLGR